jgi:hypothetical protein
VRDQVNTELEQQPNARHTRVLHHLGIVASSWHHQAVPSHERRRRGPKPKPVPKVIEDAVLAKANPWYGYKRIAVMCPRAAKFSADPRQPLVTDRQCYLVAPRAGSNRKVATTHPRRSSIGLASKSATF